jgi:hypothetical protein
LSFARAVELADAILYEGYMLYPYRRSALKNRAPTIIGVVPPRDGQGVAGHAGCECLISGEPSSTTVEAKLRFLVPVAVPGDAEQAVAQEVAVAPVVLGLLERRPSVTSFTFEHPGRTCVGTLTLAAALCEGAMKLSITVTNASPARDDGASGPAMLSTHVLVAVANGGFVSLQDPPKPLASLAKTCLQDGLWPILIGDRGRRDLLIASPMIFPDHPEIAPESPSALFDGTEIEEMLRLRILTLADAERAEIARGDPLVRELIARAEALGPEQLAGLHGTIRPVYEESSPPRTLRVRGRDLGVGDRVRLRPAKRSDVMDVVLAERGATIVSVEQDYDERTYFAVTVDGDPGEDLGALGKPGHRFFFGPDEVEPLS